MSVLARFFKFCFVLVVLIILAAPSWARAETRIFVDFGVIQGDSTDDRHLHWVDAEAASDSVSMTVSVGGGGAGEVGRASFLPLKIVKGVDRASPKLYEACAKGTHIPEVVIEFVRSGGSPFTYLQIRLQEVIITEVTKTTQHPDVSQEIVAIDWGRITLTYTIQKPDGSSGGYIRIGWDKTRNTGF